MKTRQRSTLTAAICLPTISLMGLLGCQGPASPEGAAATAQVGTLTSPGTGPASDGQTGTGSGTGAGTGTETGTSAPPSSSSTVGESCVGGDANKICLGVHFVAYKNSSGTPTASTTQAAAIIHTMNTLWAQCDIGFQIDQYDPVDPTVAGLVYGAASQSQLNQIRNAYDTPSNELLAVTTGPWGTAVNGWTNLPGDGVYGAIMEASIVEYGGGIIYAHEFGHYLGLDHVSDTANLMNPVIYTTSKKLTASQCQQAVETSQTYWKAMIRK